MLSGALSVRRVWVVAAGDGETEGTRGRKGKGMVMGIERNEAGWGTTKAGRRAALEGLVEKVTRTVEAEGSENDLAAVMFVAVRMVPAGKGDERQARVEQSLVVYGQAGLLMLVEAADLALTQVGENIVAGEQERRASLVKGRRKNVH